ncbi:hypothetical protein, partial [Mycobacterium sp. SMC-4]|uniref:hypothetical protein n=1 Tax=Mycobacterium sp. SMC-4 TaxID=2857059 RepID=UPI003D06A382
MKLRRDAISVGLAGAAMGAVLLMGAPSAAAQPLPPTPPAPVVPAPVQPVVTSSAQPVVEGVPHLASPDNLPPGTTTTPVSQSRLDYLRDLWHAMRTQEVSGSDALLLLTQRPLSSGPQVMQPIAPPAALTST